MIKIYVLVGSTAVGPYLPIASSERTHVPHLLHCTCKIREENSWVGAVAADLRISRASIVQLLIRVKQAFAVH